MSEDTQVGELEGRELDAAVGREVVGLSEVSTVGTYKEQPRGRINPLPRYSTDMNAVWRAIQGASHVSLATNGNGYTCCVQYGDSDGTASGDTAAEAIARAALKAVRAA